MYFLYLMLYLFELLKHFVQNVGNFVSANSTEIVFVTFDDSTKQYKAANSGSYMCNSESKLNLNSTVTLQMTDFQYAAFQKNITSFKDSSKLL